MELVKNFSFNVLDISLFQLQDHLFEISFYQITMKIVLLNHFKAPKIYAANETPKYIITFYVELNLFQPLYSKSEMNLCKK